MPFSSSGGGSGSLSSAAPPVTATSMSIQSDAGSGVTVSGGGASSLLWNGSGGGGGAGGGLLTVVFGDVTLESFVLRLVPRESSSPLSATSPFHGGGNTSGEKTSSTAPEAERLPPGHKRPREADLESSTRSSSSLSSSSSPPAAPSSSSSALSKWRWEVIPSSRPFNSQDVPIADVQLFQNFSPSVVVALRSGGLVVLDVGSMERQAYSAIGRFHRGAELGGPDSPLAGMTGGTGTSVQNAFSSHSAYPTPGHSHLPYHPSNNPPLPGYGDAVQEYSRGSSTSRNRQAFYSAGERAGDYQNSLHHDHKNTRVGVEEERRWGQGANLSGLAGTHTTMERCASPPVPRQQEVVDASFPKCLVVGKPFSICILDHNAIAVPDRDKI